MKIDGIEREAIRPHRRARRHFHLLEYGAIAQWLDHLAPFRQDVREVPYPGSAIRKLKPDTMIIKRLYASHLNILTDHHRAHSNGRTPPPLTISELCQLASAFSDQF